jgi:hypothetical protein
LRANFILRWCWVVGAAVLVLLVAKFDLRIVGTTLLRIVGTDVPGPPKADALFSLEELCRDSFDSGWRIKHPPDLPGPYRRRLPGFYYYHPGEGGSCAVRLREPSGAVVWEEWTRPGVHFFTLVLETSDGLFAHGLLVQGE